jgi:MFS transporter, SHS family, lactate transporter
LLVLYIRAHVDESPTWLSGRQARPAGAREGFATVRAHLPTFLFMVVLMACFNAFSHGSQDLYPTFLQVQHGYTPRTTGTIAIVYNLGALCGGVLFGAISERIGRRRAIALASILALPMIPLWAYSTTPLMFALGAFLMQFMVQGAWGIVPAHLNEISPPGARAILPGVAYQLGNLVMSRMGPVQAGIAERHGNDYALALAWTVGLVGVVLAIVVLLGQEKKSLDLARLLGGAEIIEPDATPPSRASNRP